MSYLTNLQSMNTTTESRPDTPQTNRQRKSSWSLHIAKGSLRILFAANLAVLGLLIWPFLQVQIHATASPTPLASTTPAPPTPSPSPTASLTPTPTSSPTPHPFANISINQGLIVLAIAEGGYSRLFAFQPLGLPLTRLTGGAWDDLTPALSPDQKRVVFASNRDGQWDLYLLDLTSGEVSRLTDSPEYVAAPSWSPDGQFIAYETYLADNLEIAILSMAGDQPPINISDHPAADFSPAWSPGGRQIAFVSTRSGGRDIWLADLDKHGQERFTNLSQNWLASEDHPAWSPDGSRLAWSAMEAGSGSIYLWEGGEARRYPGSGDWPVWSPDGKIVLSSLADASQTYLLAFAPQEGILAMPPLILPGSLGGLTWNAGTLPWPVPPNLEFAAQLTPTPSWLNSAVNASDLAQGRQQVAPLAGVEAPYPMLHDMVDESFQALRDRAGLEAGWDFLATLENAFVPITASLPPGMGDDWLYTGRAIAVNTLPLYSEWMAVVQEQLGADTYWRVYLRARFQDGSQGLPLKHPAWDFNKSYGSESGNSEQDGDADLDIPEGYWVDFTKLAQAYGWERLPALATWRTSFPAARFNQFVHSGGLEWRPAMLELYPPEALITPTLFVPPTITPTPYPMWYRTPTPTP